MTNKKFKPTLTMPLSVTINNLHALSEINKLQIRAGDVLIVSIPDIPATARNEYAQAFIRTLRQASKKLNALVESESIGILYITPDANLQLASPDIMRQLGWAHESWGQQEQDEASAPDEEE